MKLYQTTASTDHPKEVRKGSDDAIVSRITIDDVHAYTITVLASGRLIINTYPGAEGADVLVDGYAVTVPKRTPPLDAAFVDSDEGWKHVEKMTKSFEKAKEIRDNTDGFYPIGHDAPLLAITFIESDGGERYLDDDEFINLWKNDDEEREEYEKATREEKEKIQDAYIERAIALIEEETDEE